MSIATHTPSLISPTQQVAALRAINYDWTMHLRSVWADPAYDSPEIHTKLREEFNLRLAELQEQSSLASPMGWRVVGRPGSGKTHWLSICRQQAVARHIGFVLVDMTDVSDFWSTVLQGYLDSLQQEYSPGKFQQQILIEKFLSLLPLNVSVARALDLLPDFSKEKLAEKVAAIVGVIRKRHPREAAMHQDVIRALLATTSNDLAIHSAGFSWLNANPVDDDMRRLLGFTTPQKTPREIVKALSWLMSLCGPTVLAFDQLDPIVSQLDPQARAESQESSTEGLRAISIIREIAGGLMSIYDTTFRTLSVVLCLDSTNSVLQNYAISSWSDRYEEPRVLNSLDNLDAAAGLLFPRVDAGCRKAGINPPYPTWPIAPSVLSSLQGISPRELLKRCEAHRRQCLANNEVVELTQLESSASVAIPPAPTPVRSYAEIDAAFAKLRASANVTSILEQSTEDERLAPLLFTGCRMLVHEVEMPDHLEVLVDEFHGGKTTKPLHARIRVVDHQAGDREEHFCFRALERQNAAAFQARLKGALNGSGIDRRLSFRHCLILRSQPMPSGTVTQKLVEQFQENRGRWHCPTEDEIRTLYALNELRKLNHPDFSDWRAARQPASNLAMFTEARARLIEIAGRSTSSNAATSATIAAPSPASPSSTTETLPSASVSKLPAAIAPPAEAKSAPTNAAPPDTIPLGIRQIGAKQEAASMPLSLLEKHTIVLAGAGSGKTVLLKRLIEEAAIAGIPSIVLDGANDLSALGDRWPETPASWTDEDRAKAESYFASTDVIHWTPGRESGNPLLLEPLPDLAAVAADREELQMAVDAAVEGLASLILSGTSTSSQRKVGILAKALKFYAQQGGGGLEGIISLLADLPAEAGLGIRNEQKYAAEMADSLRAKVETSPMLRGAGMGLDPAVLFGDSKRLKPGARVSIISMIGLATPELRQQFVYQLGMTLFSWIKKNPVPVGRPLRGLLIVDEARDFIPSQKSIPSKASLQLLASQARKYHLGLVFATQNPREVENRIIGNCATHFYGRASSPASIQVIQESLRERGGRGDDIASLKPGQFYTYNSEAGLPQPVRLQTALCLSRHFALDEQQVIQRAADSRRRLSQLA